MHFAFTLSRKCILSDNWQQTNNNSNTSGVSYRVLLDNPVHIWMRVCVRAHCCRAWWHTLSRMRYERKYFCNDLRCLLVMDGWLTVHWQATVSLSLALVNSFFPLNYFSCALMYFRFDWNDGLVQGRSYWTCSLQIIFHSSSFADKCMPK